MLKREIDEVLQQDRGEGFYVVITESEGTNRIHVYGLSSIIFRRKTLWKKGHSVGFLPMNIGGFHASGEENKKPLA